MGVVINQGQVKRLLNQFNMTSEGNLYEGIGRDGMFRKCTFHYHKDGEDLRKGTANAIAHQLGFKNSTEMKKYIDKNL
jgi:hypothetical protein